MIDICYRCEITSILDSSVHLFDHLMSIQGIKLDCGSSTITQNSAFTLPAPIPYNSDGSTKSITTSYSDLWVNSNEAECVL